MTVTQVAPIAQTALMPNMGEVAKLRAELEREREGRKRAQARAERAERERNELATIIQTGKWTPTERIAYATIRLQAKKQEGEYLATGPTTIKRLADCAGLSKRTLDDKLDQFRAEGLLEYKTRRWGETEDGRTIATRHVDSTPGARYMAETIVNRIPAALPFPLPEIGTGKNAERSKEKAAADRREYKRVREELQTLMDGATCPHCHETGKIEVKVSGVCHGCGAIFDEQQVEYLAHTPDPDPEPPLATEAGQGTEQPPKAESVNPPLHIELPEGEEIQNAKFAFSTEATKTDDIKDSKCKVCATPNKSKVQSLHFESSEPYTERTLSGGDDSGPDYDWSGWGMVNHA